MRNVPTIVLLLTTLLIGYTDSVRPSEKPMRVVTIKIVADRIFASQEVWEHKAERQIKDVAEEVRDQLGVDLKIIGYAAWRGNGADSLYKVVASMMDNVPAGDADILIGFTYGPCPDSSRAVHIDGMAMPFRGLVVRSYYAPCSRNTFTPYALIHEMVHLFGGVHVEQGTLMSPVLAGNIYLELDPINRAIVGLTRDIDFRKGYASLDRSSLEKLVALYKKAIAISGGDMTVLNDLGDVYRALGRYKTALDIYRGLLEIDSTRVPTWLNISECYFTENQTDSAFATLDQALEYSADSGQVYYRMAKFHFKLGEFELAYRYAAQAAWRGIAVDSGFTAEIRKYYVPGETRPEERK